MYRGLWAGGASTPGYGIGPTDLKSIQSQLVGLPITVEHEGLMAAAETITGSSDPASAFSAALSQMEGAKRSIGRVSAVGQNDDVYFEIDDAYDSVKNLLDQGLLRGLSLTHSEQNQKKIPLELTLTNDPVRTAAFVTQQYLPREMCPPKIMSAPMETSTSELSPLEKAMSGMDAETRKLFEARFSELMGKITELETSGASKDAQLAEGAELAKQLEAAKAEVVAAKEAQGVAKTNNEILAMQVKQLLDGHLPDQSDLGKMETESIERLIGDEATTGEAFRQVVMACSRRVHQRMADLQSKASIPPAVPAPPAEEESAPKRSRGGGKAPAQEFDLSRALREQFH